MSFRLVVFVPKSMTLNDLKRRSGGHLSLFHRAVDDSLLVLLMSLS